MDKLTEQDHRGQTDQQHSKRLLGNGTNNIDLPNTEAIGNLQYRILAAATANYVFVAKALTLVSH